MAGYWRTPSYNLTFMILTIPLVLVLNNLCIISHESFPFSALLRAVEEIHGGLLADPILQPDTHTINTGCGAYICITLLSETLYTKPWTRNKSCSCSSAIYWSNSLRTPSYNLTRMLQTLAAVRTYGSLYCIFITKCHGPSLPLPCSSASYWRNSWRVTGVHRPTTWHVWCSRWVSHSSMHHSSSTR
jgi:hypothetical protein